MDFLHNLKSTVRKLAPKQLLNQYHKCWAMFGAFFYEFPSQSMTVIGVTGTNGKTTTCHIIAHILEIAGYKVGMASTIDFKIGDKLWVNTLKQGMLGHARLQKFLKDMKNAGCAYAVIESTSEGLAQFRAWGIDYRAAVFTNLTPEHIEAHGSFEKYKEAKGILFDYVVRRPFRKKHGRGESISVINADDPHAGYFLKFKADKRITYGITHTEKRASHFCAEGITMEPSGSIFFVRETEFFMPLMGKANIYNGLAGIALCFGMGLSLNTIKDALATVPAIPGRIEAIKAGQPFAVIIDYAHDPVALENLYETVRVIHPLGRLINVLGAVGGGRDRVKRKPLGKLAGRYGDSVVITNEDPYEDDPMQIIREVEEGVQSALCIRGGAPHVYGETYFIVEDRREAIQKAFSLAQKGDVVVISGKGAEETMAVKGGYISWSDKKVAMEILSA